LPERRNREAEAENITLLTAIDARVAIIDKELAANFPDCTALAGSEPLWVEEVQAQLAANETLVLFLDTPEFKPTPEETFIWVVTKTDVRWVRFELGTMATHEAEGHEEAVMPPGLSSGRPRVFYRSRVLVAPPATIRDRPRHSAP
jgi:hypothetical protein